MNVPKKGWFLKRRTAKDEPEKWEVWYDGKLMTGVQEASLSVDADTLITYLHLKIIGVNEPIRADLD